MLVGLMHDNFMEKGYHTIRMPQMDEKNGRVFVEYVRKGDEAYIVSLLDYHNADEWERNEYDDLTRSVKSFFYNQGVTKAFYLHVIVTARSDQINELGIYMDPYWVVDDENLRLMVYENQIADFLDVREIIEASLQGKSLKKERTFPVPVATILLMAANVIVFGVMEVLGSTLDTRFMLQHGAMNVERITVNREYYRLLTSMFLHFGIGHLSNNMMILGMFGYYMEGFLGRLRFLALYLGAGLAAGLASFGFNMLRDRYVVAAGASGAIFGLMGGMLYLVLKNRGRLRGFGLGRLAFFVALSLYGGFTSQGVDNAAHIGGFICGFAILPLLRFHQRQMVVDEE